MENIKPAKGNECSHYKSTAAIVSSSLPICPIHIFSSDNKPNIQVLHFFQTLYVGKY
jgi:hypothetical protein